MIGASPMHRLIAGARRSPICCLRRIELVSNSSNRLVNEAYLRLVDYRRMHWQNCAHFLAVSAQAMRRILVDHARRHNLKREARAEHVSLDADAVIAPIAPMKRSLLHRHFPEANGGR